jgi:outer membrane protein assembly factor BamB
MPVPFATAADWPQWRGANRDAKVTDFTAPATWPKALTQKWKVPVGDGVATPALVGDKLFVFSRQENSEIIRCLDAASGKEIWAEKYETQGSTDPGGFAGPRASAAVAEGKVVTLGVRGMLSCVDAATGQKLWRKDDFRSSYPRFFTSSSPIIADGLVIAQLGGQNNGAIVAYDLNTGEEKWKMAGDGTAYSSPVIMTLGGAKLVVALTEHKIIAVNLADGKPAWETAAAGADMRSYNAATPIVDGQTLIYCGGGQGTTAVKIEKEGDKVVAKPLWHSDKGVMFSTPVLKDGQVYGLTPSNELFCLNAETGKPSWSAPLGSAGGGGGGGGTQGGGPGGGPPPGDAPPDRRGGPGGGGGGRGRGMRGGRGGGGGYGALVDAGSVLLALTPTSELIVFAPSDKQFTEQARIKVADTPTYAYPVVSGNRVYIKDKDSLTLWTID